MVDRVIHPATEVTIAVVGKYMKHRDAYKSVYESLDHAGISQPFASGGPADRGRGDRPRWRRGASWPGSTACSYPAASG